MPEFTHRRSFNAPAECWHVFYGRVRVDTIALRAHDEDHLWCWSCRFYPTAELRECPSGIAADFDQARAELEKAWRVLLAKRTSSHRLLERMGISADTKVRIEGDELAVLLAAVP